MELLSVIFWILVALLLLLPAAFGVYLLATPSDRIYENWVRLRQAHSALSLKDEHFKNFPRMLSLLRVISLFVVGGCAAGLYFLLLSF